ncbi:uncharacterized protein LOC109807578 isoform X2 [Cajanus cajan]|uniref:uncharacterized protein LOC109807578 isoform X1 n=1 Tax=Cajanus cajan TaxID=3821 RepID=UPI00098D8EAC|nr:uncharacterized protein LOC109807578 isoform X1 [Cajanus cajan]XP_029129515.1 uncharacterized protein LOC109807578 isoform X2 [Cajanus cajan]
MAEESTTNQMKSEKIEPEDANEKANPNEGLTITKVPPKILSRYLSAPKASCHDLCKYGIPHGVQTKPWSWTHKRVTRKERKSKVPEENMTYMARTKKSGSSSKPSQTSKIEKANSPVDIKEVTHEEIVTSEKNSPPFQEADISTEHNSDLKQAHSEPSSLPVQECSKTQTKRERVKNKTRSSRSIKETESRSKQTRKPSLPFSSKHNVKKPPSLSSKSTKNMTRESSLKLHENVEEVKPELASTGKSPDRILHVIEPASADSSENSTVTCDATKLSSPSPSPSPSSSSSGDKSLNHTNKKTGESAVCASSKKGLRSVAGNKGKSNMLPKTHSVSRPRSLSLSSSFSSSNSSLEKRSNATYKSNRIGHDHHQGENVRIVYKIRQKMSRKVGAANKVVAARKLNFKRGKVIELQPQTNTIARRLKFRPARILGDDMRRDINGARKRTIMDNKFGGGKVNGANTKSEKAVAKLQIVEGSKRRSIGRKVGGDRSKIEGSKSGSEKVVLRHQNVEGKKENPRLYNNVIEETASMLAEQRKSKVKALVGAFETVISLDSPREATSAEVSTPC